MKPSKVGESWPMRLVSLVALYLFLTSCSKQQSIPVQSEQSSTSESIIPVPLSDTGITGFNFPEDSLLIYDWLAKQDTSIIYSHAWGLWSGLTSATDQIYQGKPLLVFETWLGLGEIQSLMKENSLQPIKTGRTPLQQPKQFEHSATLAMQAGVDTTAGANFGANFWVTVSYNPSATNYALQNQIFKKSVLDSYKKPGEIGAIPQFPSDAITIKPTYYVGNVSDNYIRIPAWPGPPDTPKPFGPNLWDSYIFVDVSNGQLAGKPLVPVGR